MKEIFKVETNGFYGQLFLVEKDGEVVMGSRVKLPDATGVIEHTANNFHGACYTVSQALKGYVTVGEWRRICESIDLIQKTDWNTLYWTI